MKQITTIILFIALVFISSCNKDEPRFSSSEIQKALFELKGTYHGEMRGQRIFPVGGEDVGV